MIRFGSALLRLSLASAFSLLSLLAGTAAFGAVDTAAVTTTPAADTKLEVPPTPASEPPTATTLSEPAAAAPASPRPAQVQLAEAIPGGGDFPFVRAVGGLGLVLSCIVGGFVAVRKFAPQCLRGATSEKALRVIETLPMGDKRSLALVQVGDQRLLIGTTSHQISVLSALGGPWSAAGDSGVEPPNHSPLQAVPGGRPRESFRGLYESQKGRRSGAAGRTIPADIRAKMRQLRDGLESR